MHRRAANEHHQEARWRDFLMFVVMVLLVIRAGLMSRGMVPAIPLKEGVRDGPVEANHRQSSLPPDLRQATLALLCLAEAAGRLVIVNARDDWELMNLPLPRPAPERTLGAANQCDGPGKRLDTS